jgi:uncharacterized protein (DUF1697 family)
MIRTVSEIEKIVELNPFKAIKVDKSIKLYVCFCSKNPNAEVPTISAKEACEVIAIDNREIFIVSRLMKNGRFGFPNNFIEKELGTVSTAQNWNTVCKMIL